ncbi:MAG: hypothetical protein ACE5DR_05745 [Thermodesulfobacteriota bacterium]
MDYGWDKYRDEGVEEIKRLIASTFFINKPAQKQILDKYAEIYQNGEEGTLCLRRLGEQGPREDDNRFTKRVSKNVRLLRTSFKKFYNTEEGRTSDFELYFIAEKEDFRLGIRPRAESTVDEDGAKGRVPTEDISYAEHHIIKTKYRPLLLFAVPLMVAAAALISLITGGIFVENTILFAFLLAVAVVVLFVSRNLYRLPHWRFAHFFHRYFLRLSGKKIILATYSSACPECGGDVELTSGFVKGTGYIARCRNNQHSHTFSFDHTSLKGERL